MAFFMKLRQKWRKMRARYHARKRLAKRAAEHDAHEIRLSQVQRVAGTEHRIERGIDVMEAARRSVYGAHMVPRTTDFGVTTEQARALNVKQHQEDASKAAADQQEDAIFDGGSTKDVATADNDNINKLV
ncbi:uncharacterized protein BKA55DRAFT_532028 [Fusarium redolens]|uniref:Uncharacterized protein n=1 Tax=Fusarium redolens TaxID=48865 RepID=A0A9P9KVZ1_FUSRE|nr:uncharacterized protein BKA55DRAFT_532028 [Fusarium redolens]KAH7269375.1 hypothetical protein BKA55DRAFT_532028 [Fusarium redolens]